MVREVIVSDKTVEAAIEQGCRQLQKERDDVEYEILEMPKKGLFGKIKSEAKVRVYLVEEEDILASVMEKPAPKVKKEKPQREPQPQKPGQPDKQHTEKADVAQKPAAEKKAMAEKKAISPEISAKKLEAAQQYIRDILAAMDIHEVEQVVEQSPEGATITLKGADLGVIIGRRGETLDALQYLVSLCCNKLGGDYYRITVDCGNFREKREQTLKELAAKIARTVSKTGRSCTLEPMNPYERRIIHSVISETEGVTSKSIGEEPHRKVVISSENPRRNDRRRGDRRPPRGGDRRSESRKPAEHPDSQPQQEQPNAQETESFELPTEGKLYGKIEL